MGLLVLQSLALAVFAAGPGHLLWRLARRRVALPASAWVWFGLAGFYAVVLAAQALVYLDVPVRRTAPALFALCAAGAAAGVGRAWRRRREAAGGEGRAAALFVGAALLAMAVQLTSLVGVGRERFLGKAQVDHVNYVATAQFLADEPFSTEARDIGLRPWLVLPLEWKEKRITGCVAVALVAVVGGTDAQEAWGPTAVFFVGLLALALAGMWRAVAGCGAPLAAALGFAGAALPAVGEVFLLGFFAQLGALAVFPALVGVLWPGAAPRTLAVPLATVFLGFLAGGYIQFWPLGVGILGAALLLWPLGWGARLATGAGVAAGSLALTSGYAVFLGDALRNLGADVAVMGDAFDGWVPGGIGWASWGRQFVHFDGAVASAGVAVVLVGAALAGALRRAEGWRLLVLLAAPLLLAARFVATAPVAAYPLHKLALTFAPICVGWALLGWLALGARFRGGRAAAGAGVAAFVGLATAGTVSDHRGWVRATREQGGVMERLWAAKARVRAEPAAAYYVGRGDKLVGAWLAYFARSAEVHYGLPAIADRRVPTETHAFRHVPPGRTLAWLDLEATGPVAPLPTVRARVVGAREELTLGHRRSHVLAGGAALELARAPGDTAPRRVQVEFGLTPLAGAVPVAVRVGGVERQTFALAGPTLVRVPVAFGAGEATQRVEIAGGAGPEAVVVLQSLSVEAPDG